MNTSRLLAWLGAIALAASVPLQAFADDGYIGIYADQYGQSACASVPQGTGTTLYILATPEGASADGITGAEFRIEVTDPDGWFFAYTAPNGSYQIGGPLDLEPGTLDDGSGLTLAFSSCQQDSSGKVLLGTLGVYNLSGGPTQLLVKGHSAPPNPAYSCASFTLCDDPYFTTSCTTPTSTVACSLSTKAYAMKGTDPVFFASSLNGVPQGPPVDAADLPKEANDLLVRMPVLLSNPEEPDIVGRRLFGDLPQKVTADTTWPASYTFESGAEGWTTADNRAPDTRNFDWNVTSNHAGEGYIRGKAVELSRYKPCWRDPSGYGNHWDYSIKLSYKGGGTNPTLSFDYLSDSQLNSDFVTVECDSAGLSQSRVHYETNPRAKPSDYRDEVYSRSGLINNGHEIGIPLENYTPNNPNIVHKALIRFSSDWTRSDEDSGYVSSWDAGIVVDSIVVTGGLAYSENFENWTDTDSTSNVSLVNTSAPAFGKWARRYQHITDNDRCTDNTSYAWLLSDLALPAYYGDEAYGPDGAVVRNWLDNVLTSPWINGDPNKPHTVVRFREFPGNKFTQGYIVRAIEARGIAGSCTTSWSQRSPDLAPVFENLSVFSWVTQTRDISTYVDKDWGAYQIRFRIADWQLFTGYEPPTTLNTGPGPYLDDVRIGRFGSGEGITLYTGPDGRWLGQDAFPSQSTPPFGPLQSQSAPLNIFGTCAFSMALDLNANAAGKPVRPGDSLVVEVTPLSADTTVGVSKVGFYFWIVAGPHAGKVPPGAVLVNSNTGLCGYETTYSPVVKNEFLWAVDPPDDYFRGGDVVQYFWWAMNNASEPEYASNPPGVTEDPTSGSLWTQDMTAVKTGGLWEVSFLPTVNWAASYLARVQADEHGNVEPTTTEMDSSSIANCILYVNKVNTQRRSGDYTRTSFMYTLDRLGYSEHYDVYDLMGFGNTNNDLVGRATTPQATGYALIVHDVGRMRTGTIPDGSDRALNKFDQASWYRQWLSNGITSRIETATLWVIGENVAEEKQGNSLILTDMGIAGVEVDQGFGRHTAPEVVGQTGFTFWNNCSAVFTGDNFSLSGACPTPRDYDGLSVSSGTITHKYKEGTDTSPYGAIVMNKNAGNQWNTIMTAFNWFDIREAVGDPPNRAEMDLAGKVFSCVLPINCQRGVNSTGLPPGEDTDALPKVTALYQNVPNPFNPTTIIKFDLAKDSEVKLDVFDVAGHLVRTLVTGVLPRQHHAVPWNGLDNQGQRVSSGVYMYRLQAGDFSQTRKLVVLR